MNQRLESSSYPKDITNLSDGSLSWFETILLIATVIGWIESTRKEYVDHRSKVAKTW